MREKPTKYLIVLVLIAVIVIPVIQTQNLSNNSEGEISSRNIHELNPVANPVAPLSQDIHYSSDPGGTYSPEPKQVHLRFL